MRTLIDIQNERKKVASELADDPKNQMIKERYSLLKRIEAYMSLNPREKYLIDQREKLEAKIKSLKDGYDFWLKNNKPSDVDMKKAYSFYADKMELNKYRMQLRVVNEILG